MAAHPTRALPPHLLVIVLVLGLAAPVGAQRAVISVGHPGVPPATDLIDITSGVVTRLSNDVTDKMVFLSDGAVLLRRKSGEHHWRARFTSGGAELSLPDGFAPVFFGASPPVIPHPRAVAVFARYRDQSNINLPARLDASGLRVFEPCGAGQPFGDYDLSPDGARVMVSCVTNASTSAPEFVVFDALTGQVISQLDVPLTAPPSAPVFINSATEFLSIRSSADFTLVRANLQTGVISGTVSFPFYGGVAPGLLPNPRDRDRPLLVRCAATCTVDVVDAVAMSIGPRLHSGGAVVPIISFPADGRSVVLSGVSYVAQVDLATGAPLTVIPAPADGFIVAAWGAEPQAPVLAPAVVAGNTVTLSWTLPAASTAVTGYRLEAGSQPGLADILTSSLSPTPSFGAAGVPAGRYYVRIRALNDNGVSAPSNEAVVDVP